jgi:hypothetical protein
LQRLLAVVVVLLLGIIIIERYCLFRYYCLLLLCIYKASKLSALSVACYNIYYSRYAKSHRSNNGVFLTKKVFLKQRRRSFSSCPRLTAKNNNAYGNQDFADSLLMLDKMMTVQRRSIAMRCKIHWRKQCPFHICAYHICRQCLQTGRERVNCCCRCQHDMPVMDIRCQAIAVGRHM